MKKTTTALLGLSALLAATLAQAEIIYETYTYSGPGDYDAYSVLTPGEQILFGFDMENVGGGAAVPTSFDLTEDAVGGVSGSIGWLGGSLKIDLYSIDSDAEITDITVTAYNGTLDALVLDNFIWNRNSASDPIYTVVYDFTAADLAVFEDWGLANVSIGASTNNFMVNDFAISRVSMAIDVPEPAMFSLLGLGLLGFGFARRARKA